MEMYESLTSQAINENILRKLILIGEVGHGSDYARGLLAAAEV